MRSTRFLILAIAMTSCAAALAQTAPASTKRMLSSSASMYYGTARVRDASGAAITYSTREACDADIVPQALRINADPVDLICETRDRSRVVKAAPAPSPTPPPAPAPAPSSWSWLAGEGLSFTLTAATQVRYGADGQYRQLELAAGTYDCTSARFGGDPAPGVYKRCEGGSAAAPAPAPSPAPAPAPAPSPAPEPAPSPAPAPGSLTLYFSDCAAGAVAGCAPGNNANPGTEAQPKRDLANTVISNLPAGTQLLFKRGGAWAHRVNVMNTRATAAQPLVFGAYGTGPRPIWQTTSGVGVQLGGNWSDSEPDGHYVFRGISFRGTNNGSDPWGFWLVSTLTDVTLQDVEITGYGLGIHSSNQNRSVNGIRVVDSHFRQIVSMGWLGSVEQSVIENNLFESINFSGSFMNHAIYLGGGRDNVIRGNRFLRNSQVNGQCVGGNVTAHGMIDGLLIEGNRIEVDRAGETCGGINIIPGYAYVERFDRVVVRGNTGVNLGQCLVCVNSAPGILIENNRHIQTASSGPLTTLANHFAGAGDWPMTDPVVRGNTVCGAGAVTNMSGATVDGNRTLPLTDPACARQ